MARLTIRGTSADLPVFDEETELVPVSSLGAEGGSVYGFEFGDVSVRDLEVTDARLQGGRIRAVRAGRATMTGVRIRSAEFTGCELSSLRWAGGRVSRARFGACRLLGARFEGVTLEHVVFTGCKLDYARFDGIRAAGPVLFAGCSLREAQFTGCDLTGCLFDGCDLFQAGFGQGRYTGCDLRGNDLSAVTGAHHLKRAVIDRAQLLQLAGALAAEAELTFGDDLPARPRGQGSGHRGRPGRPAGPGPRRRHALDLTGAYDELARVDVLIGGLTPWPAARPRRDVMVALLPAPFRRPGALALGTRGRSAAGRCRRLSGPPGCRHPGG